MFGDVTIQRGALGRLTDLLGRIRGGDAKARDALFVAAYAELHGLAQVAEMRYFGGYSEKEIAETLEIAERTVQRDWEKARLILAALC